MKILPRATTCFLNGFSNLLKECHSGQFFLTRSIILESLVLLLTWTQSNIQVSMSILVIK